MKDHKSLQYRPVFNRADLQRRLSAVRAAILDASAPLELFCGTKTNPAARIGEEEILFIIEVGECFRKCQLICEQELQIAREVAMTAYAQVSQQTSTNPASVDHPWKFGSKGSLGEKFVNAMKEGK